MGSPGKGTFTGMAQGLALVTELGFAIGLPIVLGALLGDYLDKRWGGRGLIFVAVFMLGLLSGLYNGYRLVMNAVKKYK